MKKQYKNYQVKTLSPVEQEYLNTLKKINNKIEKEILSVEGEQID